ncbi:homoserine dehydrogenase [Thermogymnomonas acidicola]|nr:homoserine dehydrogenase [Thermogymnomonas acidicola]
MAHRTHRIMVIGFGTVGQGFYELFNAKRRALGLEGSRITEIVDMRFGYTNMTDESHVREYLGNVDRTISSSDVVERIKASDADIVCEFTWVNYRDAEPAFSYMKAALESGKHVITTNKGPIALRYRELMHIASENGRKVRFKGTVMAGTPSFNILDLLPGARPVRVRGILNGTTNYILTRMSEGLSYSDALKEAQSRGYAEADPTNDVDGFDAAAKAAIISSVFGWDHPMDRIRVEGIRNITAEEAASGTKLLVYADRDEAWVRPQVLDDGDVLRHVKGVMNAIEIETDTLGKIYSMGPGAGKIETAQAALTDLVSISRSE